MTFVLPDNGEAAGGQKRMSTGNGGEEEKDAGQAWKTSLLPLATAQSSNPQKRERSENTAGML